MLTGLQIAIIGGDARQLEVIRKLADLDAKISLIGFEQLDFAYSGVVKEKFKDVNFAEMDCVILPITGTNSEGKVELIFSNEEVILTEDVLSETPDYFTIYSGISNSYLDTLAKKTNKRLVKLFERDDVAIYNSIPTVEGTIMMAIQHTEFTIHGSTVMVLGLGRVGMSLARVFDHLGANVKVGARKSEHLARITEMGLTPFHLDQIDQEVKDIDICINTIPHLIVNASVIQKMPTHTLILDIASKPGGTDFRYAEKRGIKALLAPSLPGIVAPKSAGKILGNVLAQLIEEDVLKRKE
ncbi:dipicolinic acid synthetase subunit A [Heyndrickxia ginsengihumi]|uniref:Dipicolinate synthase subunit A n=1 Tax=Heyndrickxia ginsengihumi TaxID=363870 RepID=A0A0A6VG37_9BACI|nr:dipicolinic acid synthetase subunit A [Heyndrickxia ginsengihumi]KHD86546.1 dipicolinate synthase subunit A [Heyndrickxia ginsengihumi]MBE6182804.1 dipicolinic acid synthetase subunit A [Bacillus sp. (in: firmicutes)]MCM3022544.1 dipicolinic acid synthetase subunit A [Heyndrickxia ginsengihumi]